MKSLPIKATTPAEKLLIRYANCLTIMQYTTGEEYKQFVELRKQIESEILEILENHFQNINN